MKKLLLCGVAAGVIGFAAAPAMAQIDVTVGGHTKNYVGWLDQDDSPAATEENSFDMLRESELHINAEGTADNGMVYGFHLEMEVDGGDDSNTVEESYLYLASNMGRVNLGSEDGANYLLQVAAPSADSNIDGIRQYIQPVNYGIASGNAAFTNYLTGTVAAAGAAGQVPLAAMGAATDGWDYDNDITGKDEKITYLSPVWNGFQFGLSYTPEVAGDPNGDVNSASGLVGFTTRDSDNGWDQAYEGAVRYEGTFNNVGFAVGAGYTHVEVEETTVPNVLDDFQEWNVGADLDIGAFGIGAIWTENNNGLEAGDEDRTIVLGVDYTTGPFQLGASYYDRDDEQGLANGEFETTRYTGGVIYTAAPGLSFRGSISHIEHESPTAGVSDVEATSVLGGVQLNF